jgi:PleD family two-component response regulator
MSDTSLLPPGSEARYVLVVSHETSSNRWLDNSLRALGFQPTFVSEPEDALHHYQANSFAAVLVNAELPSDGRKEVTRAILRADDNARIIAFGRDCAEARGTLVVLPAPLETRPLEVALHVALGMRARRPLPKPRHNAVRDAA